VADPSWSFMMSPQLTCTARQLASGRPFLFTAPAAPPGQPVLATLKNSQITRAS
jgi:hypothetical protein